MKPMQRSEATLCVCADVQTFGVSRPEHGTWTEKQLCVNVHVSIHTCTHVDSRGMCKALVTMAAHGGDWMVEDRDGNLHFTACLSFQVPWLPM